jgi:hypothetical protein
MFRSLFALASLWFAVVACGCSSGKTVSGKVTLDGAPAKGGVVRFTPDLDKGNKGPTAELVIREGVYSSSAEGKTIVPGEHKVSIVIPGNGAESLPREFAMQVKVPEGDKTDLDFNLESKSKVK